MFFFFFFLLSSRFRLQSFHFLEQIADEDLKRNEKFSGSVCGNAPIFLPVCGNARYFFYLWEHSVIFSVTWNAWLSLWECKAFLCTWEHQAFSVGMQCFCLSVGTLRYFCQSVGTLWLFTSLWERFNIFACLQ